jgi:hypothetical protein
MKKVMNRSLLLAAFLSPLAFAQTQVSIIPQIADGGGFQTTLVLTNTSASVATASLNFFQETGGGATTTWSPSFLETSSTQNLNLPGGGTVFLHTPGTAGATTVGWAQIEASTSVVAYAIFTLDVPGRQNQDGTATAAASASRFLVPFDNTNGFITSVALANPTLASETITVGFQPTSGASSQLTAITLPANGHMSFTLPAQFSTTTGKSGLLEFYSSTGSISILALRFNPTGAFTTAPVYAQTGAPIIGSGTLVGSGTLPQFTSISITASYIANGSSFEGAIAISGVPGPGYSVGAIDGVNVSGPDLLFIAGFETVSVTGNTFTLSGVAVGPDTYMENLNGVYGITAGNVTLTLVPDGAPGAGNVSGTFTITSSLETLTGTITGSYTAQISTAAVRPKM